MTTTTKRKQRLLPLFNIHGGKYYLSPWIIGQFPSNYKDMTYVETHGGAANVLTSKSKSVIEVYNDANGPTYNIFWSLINHTDEVIDRILLLSHRKGVFKWSLSHEFKMHDWESGVAELIKRRLSRSGIGKVFSKSFKPKIWESLQNRNDYFKVYLPLIAHRMRDAILHYGDAEEVIRKYDGPNTLFYTDPPYLPETRQAPKVYNTEMTKDQHISLAKLLNSVKGRVVLSGYDSSLYRELYGDWNRLEKTLVNRSSQQKALPMATEVLWKNY